MKWTNKQVAQLKSLWKKGTIAEEIGEILGTSKGAIIDIDMSVVYSKEITIPTTYAASDLDTKNALELIESGKIDPEIGELYIENFESTLKKLNSVERDFIHLTQK